MIKKIPFVFTTIFIEKKFYSTFTSFLNGTNVQNALL